MSIRLVVLRYEKLCYFVLTSLSREEMVVITHTSHDTSLWQTGSL